MKTALPPNTSTDATIAKKQMLILKIKAAKGNRPPASKYSGNFTSY
jgi:hypothetical protein